MQLDQIPSSTPQRHDQHSLVNFPTELLLDIFNQLLEFNNIPRSYGYTGAVPSAPTSNSSPYTPPKSRHKHATFFVSKQFSALYSQCFYERTTFFLRIDSKSAFKGVPDLSRKLRPNHQASHSEGIPDFWGAPKALLSSLRHCTLFIELGDIATHPHSLHSISSIARSNISLDDAHVVRKELETYSSLAEIRAQDALFDSALISAVLTLFAHMQQLRSVNLVWDIAIHSMTSTAIRNNTNWDWERLGETFVACLKRKRMMGEVRVKVGDQWKDASWNGAREDGVWKGKFVKTDGSRDDYRVG